MSVPDHRTSRRREPDSGIAAAFRGNTVRAIVGSVTEAVRGGRLAPGTVLPPVRALAQQAGVSPTTMAAAIAELRRHGVVVSEARRRVTVADQPPAPARRVGPPLRPGTVDLLDGGPDPALAPDLAAALDAVRAERSGSVDPGYGRALVDADLAAHFRAQLAEVGGDRGELIACSGALDVVERALAAVLRPGDHVAVEDPGYPDVFHLVRALGLVTAPVPVDDEGLDPDGLARALRAGARAVVCSPRAQNPTGAQLSAARAEALAATLAGHPDVLVIEDDHFACTGGAAVLTATGRSPRWVIARSVSKAVGPDLRLAVAAGDPTTVGAMAARMRAGAGWVSHLLQRTAFHLLTDAGAQAALAVAAETYDRRRTALLDALAERGIAAHGRSGLNVWLAVPDEAAVCLAMAEAGWAVAPGAPFRLRSGPAVRLTTSRLDPERAPAVAAALDAALAAGAGRQG